MASNLTIALVVPKEGWPKNEARMPPLVNSTPPTMPPRHEEFLGGCNSRAELMAAELTQHVHENDHSTPSTCCYMLGRSTAKSFPLPAGERHLRHHPASNGLSEASLGGSRIAPNEASQRKPLREPMCREKPRAT